MGTDASNSVTNSFGQTHELANLYIAGSSLFPTSGAVNPTNAIMAVSLRGAEHMAKNFQHDRELIALSSSRRSPRPFVRRNARVMARASPQTNVDLHHPPQR